MSHVIYSTTLVYLKDLLDPHVLAVFPSTAEDGWQKSQREQAALMRNIIEHGCKA